MLPKKQNVKGPSRSLQNLKKCKIVNKLYKSENDYCDSSQFFWHHTIIQLLLFLQNIIILLQWVI